MSEAPLIEEMGPDGVPSYRRWSAMHDSLSKLYSYRFSHRDVENPLSRLYRAHVRDKMDIEAIERLAQAFRGTHDFQVPFLPRRITCVL